MPMTGGRPVLPLMADAMRDQLGACADAPCAGAIIANAGAFGAVIARLSRASARRPLTLTLDMIDPVSGSPRLPQQSATLTDAATTAAALAPLTAALAPSMFSPPPPPPTLLVTVNVDGASVRIDDQDLGLSPVARATLTPGHHIITVTHPEYLSARRAIDLIDAQTERLDITLVDVSAAMGDDAIAMPVGEGTSTAGGVTAASRQWFEEPLVWGSRSAAVWCSSARPSASVWASPLRTTSRPRRWASPFPRSTTHEVGAHHASLAHLSPRRHLARRHLPAECLPCTKRSRGRDPPHSIPRHPRHRR